MKKLLLSVAVATFVAAPIAQAGSSLTGSLRYGIDVDSGDETEFRLANFGSRIKMAGDTDMGNGTTGYGKLEMRLSDSRNGAVVNRTYAVGMKGSFGDVSVGVQDTALDQAHTDVTWWNGANKGGIGDRSEKHGAILYKKAFGNIGLALGAAMQAGGEDLDVVDASVKYSSDAFSAAVGFQSKEFGGDLTGTAVLLTGTYNFGAGSAMLTFGTEDEDFTTGAAGAVTTEKTGIIAQVAVGDFYGFYNQEEFDGGNSTPTNIGVGYTQKLSDQSLIWYELFSDDADDGSDAVTSLNAAYKIDF